VEDGAARGRVHEADQITPLVAVLHGDDGAFAVNDPDLLEERFQPAAMLVP
jgi:hypothetical protein